MKEIKKNFVEIETSNMDGMKTWWETAKGTYEENVKKMTEKYNAWFTAVREVEKTFNPETFEITTKEIRRTEWKNVEYIKNKGWKREVVETIAK